ncbi:hypothetical protein ACLOJK_011659 [Asimina triloba]
MGKAGQRIGLGHLRYLGQQHEYVSCGLFSFLPEKACAIKRLEARHRIATEIRKIRERTGDISGRKDAYNFCRADDRSSINRGNSNHQEYYYPRLDALFADEADLVAIDEPKR